MGCTASVLDHDQQQEWVRTERRVLDEVLVATSQNDIRPQEQSVKSNRQVENEETKYFSEEKEEGALADDVLDNVSKLNESEHTMYEGSCDDGCFKADISVVESTITGQMGQSKSIATEDALYEDSSSDDESARGRYLCPVPVDVDDDLSKVDSMMSASIAPGPVDCDASDDGGTSDQVSIGDTLIAPSVAPDPIRSDDATVEGDIPIGLEVAQERALHNFRWKHTDSAEHTIATIELLLQSKRMSRNTKTQKIPMELEGSKWQSETNKKSPELLAQYSTNRLDILKWEKQVSPRTPKDEIVFIGGVVKEQSSSRQPIRSLSSSKSTTLKEEVALLQKQIKHLERRSSATSTAGRRYVKPSDLVVANEIAFVPEIPRKEAQHNKIDARTVLTDSHLINESRHTDAITTNESCLENLFDSTTANNKNGQSVSLFDNPRCDLVKTTEASCNSIVETTTICALVMDRNIDENETQEIRPLDDQAQDSQPEEHLGENSNQPYVEQEVGTTEADIERSSQLDDHLQGGLRRESLDSAIMQYSVSTNGNNTYYDKSCGDESVHLCGDNIVNPKTDETKNDPISYKMIIPTALVNPSSMMQLAPLQKSDAIVELTAANSETTLQSILIVNKKSQLRLETQHCDTKFERAANDGKQNAVELGHDKLLSNEVHRTASTNNDVSSQKNLETTPIEAGHSACIQGANSEVSTAIESSDDTSAFINLLNLDPWNSDAKLDEPKILDMIERNPSLCCRKHSFDGFHGCIYPLSALCALGASAAMIKKCYIAFPAAITKADVWVGTSLHYACSYHAPLPVVEYLSKKNPLALKAANQFNRLPLHMACMFDAEPSVISYLIRKYPGSCKKTDQFGMLPLHIACDSDIGIDSPNAFVVNLLSESFPEACMHENEDGATPLAISITRRSPFSIVKDLVKACPEALSIPDHKNRIPLHSAVIVKATTDVIGLLVVSYPSGLVVPDCNNEIPYDWAVRLDLGKAILDLLEPPDWLKYSRHTVMLQTIHIGQ